MRDSNQLNSLSVAPGRRVLLIGWDGADWKMINPLLERGWLPNLARLLERGVMGNIASLTPMISPLLWTSIATGKYADQHQVLGFAEPDGAGLRPVSSASRRCRALWNILTDAGARVCVVNWYASHPAEPVNGVIVSDRFATAVAPPDRPWSVPPGTVHPPELLDRLAALRLHPAETTPDQVAPFVPRLAELDPRDERLARLRVLLAQCASVHAAVTWILQETAWDFVAVYYDAIDRFAHSFMEFHPPRRPHVDARDFELFQRVMTGCYRFHDMLLGRLVELAGEDASILLVSDHGFHCDHLRPAASPDARHGQPVAWHRPYGVMVAAGPQIRHDQRIYGASLLDVTPTVLWLMGLPPARDMDGHALTQIAEPAAAAMLPPIDTYEIQPMPDASAGVPARAEDPWVAHQMIQRLVDLGYMESADVQKVVLDRQRALGHVYWSRGRVAAALAQFEQVLAAAPDDQSIRLAVAQCQIQLGNFAEAELAVHAALAAPADEAQRRFFLGLIAFRRGATDAALEHFRCVQELDPRTPGLFRQLGAVYLRRQRFADAEKAFRRELDLDPDSAEAHDGLGLAYRFLGQPARAVEEHMRSVALLHHRPRTHIHLGLALAETGQFAWAIRAFQVAIEQDPADPVPHSCLAELYERAVPDPALALQHRQRAADLRAARDAERAPEGRRTAPQSAAEASAGERDGPDPAHDL